MPFFVYVLRSARTGQFYVGSTKELDARLRQHNHGRTGWTSKFRPWELLYAERFDTRAEAMKRERVLKSSEGRELKSLLGRQW